MVEEQSADPRAYLSVPWNLVYDERPAKHKPAFQSGKGTERWRPFWSIRYNLTSGRRVEPLRRMPVWSNPRVIAAINPDIYEEMHEDQKQKLDQFLSETGITRGRLDGGARGGDGGGIPPALLLPRACHARTT